MTVPEEGLEKLIDLRFTRVPTTGPRALIEEGADYVKALLKKSEGPHRDPSRRHVAAQRAPAR
jgi:copper homeostasis protein CutC